MNSLKNIVTNPILMGLFSGLIAMLVFIIYIKSGNGKINKDEMYKISLLGFFIGLSNTILITLINDKSLSLEQDIYVGNPDF